MLPKLLLSPRLLPQVLLVRLLRLQLKLRLRWRRKLRLRMAPVLGLKGRVAQKPKATMRVTQWTPPLLWM